MAVSSLLSPELRSVDFYVRNQILALEEDIIHEFKAHRHLSDQDLSGKSTVFARDDDEDCPEKVKYLRRSLSPNICGFLNSGRGGRMYLGVTDAGEVLGFMMSQYQKDHFDIALADLLSRYTPPVPKDLVRIAFVPVKEADTDQFRKDPVGFRIRADKRHILRNSRYCWCDLNSMAGVEKGMMHNFYVIEIIFAAWGRHNHQQQRQQLTATNGTVVYDNEEGKAFMRGFASCRKLRGREIARLRNGEDSDPIIKSKTTADICHGLKNTHLDAEEEFFSLGEDD